MNEILKRERAITLVKDTFSQSLAKRLHLTKVSSPLIVLDGTGINDDLNGVERVVTFPIKSLGDKRAVVVNSLAKWKRVRLKELQIPSGEGILTDMRALRPDEDYSPIHSVYVDQWDWEKRIETEDRKLETLKSTVRSIYAAIKETEATVCHLQPQLSPILPDEITFIHSEELLQMFPDNTPKERENLIAKKHGAVFIIGIGGELSNKEAHDGRAADYDDWTTQNCDGFSGLNGDILVWNPVLQSGFELSSMGIRVDKLALEKQLTIRNQTAKKQLYFHNLLLNDQLPSSIGGGIGQSRLCMFLLRLNHIGEVQASVWGDEQREALKTESIELL